MASNTSCKRSLDMAGRAGLEEPHVRSKIRKKDIVIHILKTKLSLTRLTHLKKLAMKNGIKVEENYSDDTVTHVISSVETYDKVLSVLKRESLPDYIEVVNIEWLTDTFIEGKPVQVTDRYRLHKLKHIFKDDCKPTIPTSQPDHHTLSVTEYECQRPTLLEHPNPHLTDALELLEKYYQHLDHKQGDTRALAFRQASCTIKAIPKKITSVHEVSHLHRIGKHSMRVIEEIIETGESQEVEDIKKNEWFQYMELFTSIYGCGSATADKWYNEGLKTLDDVKEACQQLTEAQRLGLKYHDSISKPIAREEVHKITGIIEKEVLVCCPGASVEAVGGYRRGKPFSHDVDILLSHEDMEVTRSMLETVIDHLKLKGMIIHVDSMIGQNTMANLQGTHELSSQQTYNRQGKQRRTKFDHLDKAYCIVKLSSHASSQSLGDSVYRVDLIVSPPDQYPFALVSWTGSKQFNRSLRRYSVKECQKTVTAHGVYDMIERKFIKAKTEKEVFDILKLDYLEPHQRNC